MIQTIFQALSIKQIKQFFTSIQHIVKQTYGSRYIAKDWKLFLFNMYDLMYNCIAYYFNFLPLSNFFLD